MISIVSGKRHFHQVKFIISVNNFIAFKTYINVFMKQKHKNIYILPYILIAALFWSTSSISAVSGAHADGNECHFHAPLPISNDYPIMAHGHDECCSSGTHNNTDTAVFHSVPNRVNTGKFLSFLPFLIATIVTARPESQSIRKKHPPPVFPPVCSVLRI